MTEKIGRKTGGKNKTHQEILKQNRTIARYYLKGRTQESMAEKLGMSQPEISLILDKIRKQWQTSTLIDFNEAQGAALSKLDILEEKCIQKFEASEKEKRTTTQKRIPIMKNKDGKLYVNTKGELIIEQIEADYIVIEETIKKEENVGDVRWLMEIRQLLDMRLKILGLYKLQTKETGEPGRTVSVAKETTKGKMALFCAIIEEWGDPDSGS